MGVQGTDVQETTIRLILEEPPENLPVEDLWRALQQALPGVLGLEPLVPDPEPLENRLEKRVAPSRIHFQPRTKEGRFRLLDTKQHLREQPRGQGGRFISRLSPQDRAVARDLSDQHQATLQEMLSWQLEDLEQKAISLEKAASRGATVIRTFYEELFRDGLRSAGNPGLHLYPRHRALLNRVIRDEQEYWSGFMEDVEAGRGTVPYPVRLGMYGNAGREAFWLGWVLGDQRPNRRILWRLGPTDHCTTCRHFGERGPMTVQEFMEEAVQHGFLPKSGELACVGIHCQCELEDV